MQNKNIKTGRTLCVGDIHGGFKALIQVLERANFDNTKDQLICLGDYVDGWSESAEVIQKLIELQQESENRHIFIKGNHDEWCNEWMKTGVAQRIWMTQGGAATFESYMRLYDGKVPSTHQMFFYKLENYYVDTDNNGFVHGGFVSRKGLGHDPYQSDYYWDRDMWQLACLLHNREDEGNPKNLRFRKHKEVFIGHTTTTMWNNKPHFPEYWNEMQPTKNGPIYIPMNRCNVWNMDTGGGFKGKLSIMDIKTKEIWQSDWLFDLYPNEKGR